MLVHSTVIEELRASNGIGFDKFSDLTKCVFDGDNDQLLTLFHIEEFQEVVSSMHLDKASGPDSMKSTFFQQFWSIFRDDIFIRCCTWLHNCVSPNSLNDTILVLIPKNDKPNCMVDLRLIALCNLIMNNVMVAFELIHHMKNKSNGKTRGRVRGWWLGPRAVVAHVAEEAAAESLQLGFLLLKIFSWAKARGDVHGLSVCRGGLSISHLFFKDDSFLFFRAKEVEALIIKDILKWYEEVSGQAINFHNFGIMFSSTVLTLLYLARCGFVESIERALFDCYKDREVWQLAGLQVPTSSCIELEVCLNVQDESKRECLLVLMWFIWFYRNFFTWQNKDVQSAHIVYPAVMFLQN
ncbi:uncharacterized protein [Gossypium hirsutum]|uniref:Uncharacterized protein n=1 Tax=Gossypium hirsutum TaxID=3635 RepID=A0ABM3AZ68_GOSHI|nr:uncharacterized protein LOC107887507 [Gossypium hirsutum]